MNNVTTPITVASQAVAAKSRKGPAHDTTKKGAYWLALNVATNSCGGDGIGQASADVRWRLQVRHFRDGTVTCGVRRTSRHQNYGTTQSFVPTPSILGCETAEDVVAILKGTSGEYENCLSSYYESEVVSALAALGIPAALPSPDED